MHKFTGVNVAIPSLENMNCSKVANCSSFQLGPCMTLRQSLKVPKQEVPYIDDHLPTTNGLRRDPNKIKRRFLPLLMNSRCKDCLVWSHTFLPNLPDVTELLQRLLHSMERHWDDTHKNKVNQMKQLITRKPDLRYFENTRKVPLLSYCKTVPL